MKATVVQQVRPVVGLIRRKQVEEIVRLSRSSIYSAVKRGLFPAPVRIGARAVAWHLSDIETWISALPTAGAQA